METLPRVEVLILAVHLQRGDQLQRGQRAQPYHRDYLVEELLDKLRKVRDEWKPEVIAQARMFARLANLPPVHIIGAEREEQEESREEETAGTATTEAA